MPEYVLDITTAVPEHVYTQDAARDQMKLWAKSERDRRVTQYIYQRSGIDTRHSVCGDFEPSGRPELFTMDAAGRPNQPGTEERNDVFGREAPRLAVEVAKKLLRSCPNVRAREISHVVTATCTGFTNPGMDVSLVKELDLRPGVQRYNLGFMGCCAAFPALRMAQQFCRADPTAVVLVLCLELCTLHLQLADTPDQLLANALFADGAGACLVHAREDWRDASVLRLDLFASALVSSGEREMAWSIGNHGFRIALSSYVPDVIGANVAELVDPVLKSMGLGRGDVDRWAVHPGGKMILDKIQKGLELSPQALDVSRSVLRRFGNMSSATVLFVLNEMLRQSEIAPGETVLSMSFGPGLTVETGLFRVVSPPGERREATA